MEGRGLSQPHGWEFSAALLCRLLLRNFRIPLSSQHRSTPKSLSKRCDKTHHRLLHHLTHRKMMRKSPTMTTYRNQKHGGWHFISCQCLIKTNRVLYRYCLVILAGYQPTWRGRTTSRSIAIAESRFTVSNSSAFCTRCTSPLAHALMRQRATAPIVHTMNLLFIFFFEIFCKDTAFSLIMQSKTSGYKLFFYGHALYQ